jgi:hypothetical protein
MKRLPKLHKALLVLVPLGVLAIFLTLFRAALVSYLGSIEAWYAVLSAVLVIIALQIGLLALRSTAERTESRALAQLLRMIRRRE